MSIERRAGKTAGKGPLIGIWWQVGAKVVRFGASPDSVEPIDSIRDVPFNHITTWPRVVHRYRQLRHVEYDEIPRGRVIQRDGRFVVLLGKRQAQDRRLRLRIIQSFRLPTVGTQFQTDEHYTVTHEPGFLYGLLAGQENAGSAYDPSERDIEP